MLTIVRWLLKTFPSFKRWGNRVFYQYIARMDQKGEVVLMNYGYVPSGSAGPIPLDESDEKDRHSIQLYDHVATGIDLAGLDVLEVGSGRGGGASYIKRYLKPQSMIGVDFADRSVEFSNRTHIVEGLRYLAGDAEDLPLDEASIDAVINVESSHCYPHVERFFAEAYRVLVPGGHFLWTDFRPAEEFEGLRDQLQGMGFALLRDEDITPNVIEAIDAMAADRQAKVKAMIPAIFFPVFNNFIAGETSPGYVSFVTRASEYRYMVLQK